MDERKDELEQPLDQKLDSLLAGYSDVEPSLGLETRVLASLRAAAGQTDHTRWNRQWLLSLGGAVAIAAVVLSIYLWRVSTPPQPRTFVKQPVEQQPVPVKEMPPPKQAQERPEKRPGQKENFRQPPPLVARAEIRQDVFPTPAPLSDQEKLLLKYLAGTPREEVLLRTHPDESPDDGSEQLKPQVQQFKTTEEISTR